MRVTAWNRCVCDACASVCFFLPSTGNMYEFIFRQLSLFKDNRNRLVPKWDFSQSNQFKGSIWVSGERFHSELLLFAVSLFPLLALPSINRQAMFFFVTSLERMGFASIIKWSLDWTEHACSPCLYKYHFVCCMAKACGRPSDRMEYSRCERACFQYIYIKFCENCIKSWRIQSYQTKWKECWNILRNIFIYFFLFIYFVSLRLMRIQLFHIPLTLLLSPDSKLHFI